MLLLHDFFDFNARTQPHAIAIDDGQTVLTFAAAAERTEAIANALHAAGVGPGDRVAVLSRNHADMYFLLVAASKIGAVPVPLNYRLAPREWVYILNDSAARIIVAEPEYVEAIDAIRPEMGDFDRFFSFGGAAAEGWVSLEAQWQCAPPRPIYRPKPDDTLYQMYTSGTTGSPKGVLISHANLASNIFQTIMMLDRRPAIGQTALVVTPLYHAAAVWITTFSFACGMSVILHRDFDAKAVLDTLENCRVSFTFLVPAMINACLQADDNIADRDWSALDLIMYGASPISESVLNTAIETFKCGFCQAYGMTETTAILTLLTPRDHLKALQGAPELLLSAGRPLPGTAMGILDSLDCAQGAGKMGEIAAHGPQMMECYWRRPDDTAAAFRDGWLHTGDAGIMDEDGFVYLRDRIKDMVVSGGENVYPREVENVLFEHPAIADAAVIGIPDEKYGEALLACVVMRKGASLDAEALVAFCRGRLAGYKIPRRVDVLDALPRNASGKVLKAELRKPYWAGKARLVD